jgi:hypothetical protein
MLARLPRDARFYVIDIDGFDPSIAPGTGTPSHGGFLYYEVLEFLQGLCSIGEVVGVDLVEVAPAYDPAGVTAFLAAQLLMNFSVTFFMPKNRGGRVNVLPATVTSLYSKTARSPVAVGFGLPSSGRQYRLCAAPHP